MADEEYLKVNPNTADESTLQKLPGIGRSLAQKIVASRPFSGAEDLREIRGLGKVALERLEPHLSFEESASEEMVEVDQEQPAGDVLLEAEVEGMGEESILSPDGQKDLRATVSEALFEAKEDVSELIEDTVDMVKDRKGPAKPARVSRPPRTFNRTEIFWLMGAVGLVTLILSVFVSLVILGGINGTLDFNQLQSVRQIETGLGEVQGGLETLSSSVNILEERLTPLEGLTGRMTTIEEEVGVIQGDIENALVSVESMQSDLEGLSEETARLSGRVDRFDTFLEGLRQVISEIFAAPSTRSMPQK
jgi:competence ComEA-like helix-hairpin-helix protein